MSSLRVIKTVVLIMTLILFVLLGVLVRELTRAGDPSGKRVGDNSSSASTLSPSAFSVAGMGYYSCPGAEEDDPRWVVESLPGRIIHSYAAGPYLAVVVRSDQPPALGRDPAPSVSDEVGDKSRDLSVYLISPCTGRIMGEIR